MATSKQISSKLPLLPKVQAIDGKGTVPSPGKAKDFTRNAHR